MIDTENLRTASLYINNQLLSRGLLRDGQSIDFAQPAIQDGENAELMVRIVSVLNDLILRRDRDAEHRESLSATLRSLRAENLKHTSDITRLNEKHVDAKRKLEIAEASEASARTQMKSAEAQIRGLKEDLVRTKALVAQARATCTTDVRRRDRQIDTLKKQLGEAGRARGSRGNSAVISITVTGDIGAEKKSPTRGSTTEEYDLRTETNSFLAKLAQDLSEENEAIVNVMRRVMLQLREMSGWSAEQDALVIKQEGWEDMASELDGVLDHMRTILTNPSFVPIEEVMVREEEIAHLKDGWVKMENRWTEAVHLMDGWRKRMAASGRPVNDEELQMGLRLSPVRVKDVEDTRLAPALPLAPRLSAVAEESEEEMEPVHSSPCPSARVSPGLRAVELSDQEESDAESDFDQVPVDEYDVEEPNVQILQQSTAAAPFQSSLDSSPPMPDAPKLSPLKDSASAGNRGLLHLGKPLKRPGEPTTAGEKTRDLAGDASKPFSDTSMQDNERDRASSSASLEEVLLSKGPSEPAPRPAMTPPRISYRRDPESSQASARNSRDSGPRSGPPSPNRSPRRNAASRLPLPRNAEPGPQQSPLTMATIAAKLAASEREADAARVRAKLRAARGTRGVKKPTITHSQSEPKTQGATQDKDSRGTKADDVDPIKRDPSPVDEQPQLKPEKRRRDRRASKTSSRRRSTLSPWELESLMTGNVQ
ncbi:Afadin and alpha-actinin-binding-domain-containing protein [Thelonectria olida]|uniref:Afadin and alpha-actinin-binding-domain-containing protein n=1 Tax=Thelonectria olida TaxID=1576542 RepID=A0A9P9AWG2_9HYPO|nr:Afadin and alpha-actinin-binding-domain-containing protein [Thelonectria olida]